MTYLSAKNLPDQRNDKYQIDEDVEKSIQDIQEDDYDPADEIEKNKKDVIDEDADNPPAGTPGHPGFDEDAE